jgi:hypothetical protein
LTTLTAITNRSSIDQQTVFDSPKLGLHVLNRLSDSSERIGQTGVPVVERVNDWAAPVGW